MDLQQVKIHCHHPDDRNIPEGVPILSLDTGNLAIPEHIKLGAMSTDGTKIETQRDLIWEYRFWLEDQINASSAAVLTALDNVYQLALKPAGIILLSSVEKTPHINHTHVVEQTIKRIADAVSKPVPTPKTP